MSTYRSPKASPEPSLDQYFRDAWRYPILGKNEELLLAIRWRDAKDQSAADQLVTSHLRLVAKIAMKYRSHGLPAADLISEGNIGLIKAVQKFDPDRGFRLSTYAMWWIKAAVIAYVLKSWSMVKLGTASAQKKLFFSLRRAKARLKIIEDKELTPEQVQLISEITNTSSKDVVQMNRRLSFRDTSLNAPLSSDGKSGEILDFLVDQKQSPEVALGEREEFKLKTKMLTEAINELPERERHILKTRRLSENKLTLEQLGSCYGISRERVRQLENKAFEQVKRLMTETNEAKPQDLHRQRHKYSGPELGYNF